MKVVYVYWGEDTQYAFELAVSAMSVKFFDPNAEIIVLAYEDFPSDFMVHEIDSVRRNCNFASLENYYPKRCVTNHIKSDYIQMDTDTLAVRSLRGFWDLFASDTGYIEYEGFGIIGWNSSVWTLEPLSGLLSSELAYINTGFHGMRYEFAKELEQLCRHTIIRDACPEELSWNLHVNRNKIAILGPTAQPRDWTYYREENVCGASAVLHKRKLIYDAIYRVQSAACGYALPTQLTEQLQEYLLSRGVVYPRTEPV